MRTISKYLLTAGSLTLGSLVLTPSCATNNSSLFLVGVMDIAQSACVAKPDNTGPFLTSGTLDVAIASGYTAVVLVGNQLTQLGSSEQLRTETSRVSLRGAEVQLTTLEGKALIVAGNGQSTFSTVGTGFVDAAAGDAPSYATMAVNLIPPGLTGLPAEVVAKIRVFGETLGGTSVTSSELDFPISVCDGCLVLYDTPDATEPAGTFLCATTTASSTQTSAVAPCVMGQDQQFSCTLCSELVPLCRDPSKNPTFTPTSMP